MCEVRVVSPVPYCPPLLGASTYARFRRVPPYRFDNDLRVYHPVFLVGPGLWLHQWESLAYELGVRSLIRRLRREFAFDLIHAHFGYPDGVVAAALGRRYGVPVVVTEHALWSPWMDSSSAVRKRAVRAAEQFAFHIAVSQEGRRSIARFTGDSDRLRVIPVGVDGEVFTPALGANSTKDHNQILFVGRIHHTKGVDILLRAIQLLVARHPQLRLVLVGGDSCYRGWKMQEATMHELARSLGLGDRIKFVGEKSPSEVAEYMRNSGLLVLPSRRESFGAVLVEALACGIPVVATRCGGPEDIVTDEVGLLVETQNEQALASAIESVWSRVENFPAERLRQHALGRFSWDHVAKETLKLYRSATSPTPVDEQQQPVHTSFESESQASC
jgi:glycosyltransferase involved in cell wall biosynthesis